MVLHTLFGKKCARTHALTHAHTHTHTQMPCARSNRGARNMRIRADSRCSDHQVSSNNPLNVKMMEYILSCLQKPVPFLMEVLVPKFRILLRFPEFTVRHYVTKNMFAIIFSPITILPDLWTVFINTLTRFDLS